MLLNACCIGDGENTVSLEMVLALCSRADLHYIYLLDSVTSFADFPQKFDQL